MEFLKEVDTKGNNALKMCDKFRCCTVDAGFGLSVYQLALLTLETCSPEKGFTPFRALRRLAVGRIWTPCKQPCRIHFVTDVEHIFLSPGIGI